MNGLVYDTRDDVDDDDDVDGGGNGGNVCILYVKFKKKMLSDTNRSYTHNYHTCRECAG